MRHIVFFSHCEKFNIEIWVKLGVTFISNSYIDYFFHGKSGSIIISVSS